MTTVTIGKYVIVNGKPKWVTFQTSLTEQQLQLIKESN